jgi:N-carbamoylputrescine amidase
MTNCPVGKYRQNLNNMVKWIRTARDKGADAICFPEMNITGYLNHQDIDKIAMPISGTIRKRLVSLASQENIVILAGMAEKAPGGAIYASHLVVWPEGNIGVYRKVHIAPPEKTFLTPGDSIPLFNLNGSKFGIQLCYDAHFPELSTHMALNGAHLIFVPHASPRGTPEEKVASWTRHLPARAFDNSLYVIACNQSGDNEKGLIFPGVAMVVGPSGEITGKNMSGHEGMLIADLTSKALFRIKSHRMRYFLPNRRPDLYGLGSAVHPSPSPVKTP